MLLYKGAEYHGLGKRKKTLCISTGVNLALCIKIRYKEQTSKRQGKVSVSSYMKNISRNFMKV